MKPQLPQNWGVNRWFCYFHLCLVVFFLTLARERFHVLVCSFNIKQVISLHCSKSISGLPSHLKLNSSSYFSRSTLLCCMAASPKLSPLPSLPFSHIVFCCSLSLFLQVHCSFRAFSFAFSSARRKLSALYVWFTFLFYVCFYLNVIF